MSTDRALVLGGGGVAGIAWETGVLSGLAEAGIDVTGADLVVGTSAGSTVGAQLGSGLPLAQLWARQAEPSQQDPELASPGLHLAEWMDAMARLAERHPDPRQQRQAIGAMALATGTVAEAARRAVIETRLPRHDWPAWDLRIVAVDAHTGDAVVFDRASRVGLVDAVAASCAVPGVWPPATVNGRTRAVNRLREQLLSIIPALERSFDYIHCKGALTLLTGYQTPAAIRRGGATRLERWLTTRKARNAHTLARRAVEAAASQRITLPGEALAAQIVQALAQQVLELHARIAEIDKLIASRFHQHPNAAIIESLPGFGPLLGAEFLAITGGDMTCFDTPDRLAGMAGLAPVPRDSGRISGNLHRPKRYHRGLQRVFYHSAMDSIRWSDESQRFYARKRAEGKRHTHAVLALARRRVNVLWAMLPDQRPYQADRPAAVAAT